MKYITTILLALVMVLSVPAASAVVETSLQRYDPTPAQPGDLLTAYINVANNEPDIARNVQLEIIPTSTIMPEGKDTFSVASIGAYGLHTSEANLRVARDAPAGQAILRYRVKQDDLAWQERTATITIKGAEAAVIINDVTVSPEAIQPGKSSTVTLTLENNADSLLRDITTELDLENTPFVPTGSSTRKKINLLRADQEATISYELVAQPDAEANIYRVPVTLSFLDEDGETQTDDDTFGLYVQAEPNVIAIVDDATTSETGTEIAVRIINKGLSEVKFVEATLQEQEGYTLPTSERQAYLGNIDSDDWETLRFTLSTDREEVNVPLTYTFQDAFNNEVVKEETLTVNIPAAPAQGIGFGTVLIVLLLVGAGWWYLRKRKKNKK